MHTYRLLALDMDGTLLTSDKRISPRTLQALHEAAAHGVTIALSTGRAINELTEYRSDLKGAVRYASLVSGGHVCDLETGQTIAVSPLDTETALAIARQGLVENAMVHLLTSSTTVVTERDMERVHEVGMGVYQDLYRKVCTFVDDVLPYIEDHPGEICKINLYHTSLESRERSWERLRGLDAHAVYAEQAGLELTPTGIDKARGLRLLCDHLGCSPDECVAVGDAPNDIEVLELAGLAVAMGNADDTVKALADLTVSDNDHDGVAEVVERLLR